MFENTLISTGIFIIPKFKQSVKKELLDVAREWAGQVKRNCIGGAFCKAKYEIRRRRKRGLAKIHFPHTFFSSLPERAKIIKSQRPAANHLQVEIFGL